MKQLFIIVMSLSLSISIVGQSDFLPNGTQENQSTFSISAGLENISLLDQTFSPIVFSGLAPKIALKYSQNKRDEKLWSTSISATIGSIEYRNEPFTSDYSSAEFSFSYLSKVKSSGQSKLYLGGQFRSILDLLVYDGFESASWFTGQQLEAVVMYKYSISDHQSIIGQFSHPIVSLVSRPSYAGIDEFVVTNVENIPKILYARSKLQSINNLINPNFDIKYALELKRTVLAISANYSYLQMNSIRRYSKNRVGINLDFHFKIGR